MARRETVLRIGGLEITRPRRVALSDKPNLAVSSTRKESVPVVKGKESMVAGVTGNGGHNFAGMDTGEYLSALSGSTGRTVYDQMRRSDPQVKSILNAISLPIRGANYYVEPASDDPLDVKIAQTIEDNILRGMTITWDDMLRHALLMLPFGFSILEKIWEYRDGVLGIRKLDPRLPTSIVDWKWDNTTDELIGPEQDDGQGKRYVLPIEKLLVFTLEREGDNWEGTSILRSAYKPWFIKSNLEKIDAIKHDRFGVGIPVMTAPEGVKQSDPSWAAAETTLENIQAQEQGYLLKPAGWDLKIEGGGAAAGTDVIASIKYHDGQIAKSVLAQFLELGSTETGSRALGASFIDLFLQSLQATADYLCEVINRFLIPEYVGYNWTTPNLPRLRVNKIRTLDTATVAALKAQGLLSSDLELENALRSQLELPDRKDEQVEPSKPAPEPEQAEDPEEGVEDEPEEGPDKKIEQADRRRRYADFAPEEKLIDVSAISIQLDRARSIALRRVLEIRDYQRSKLIDQACAMTRISQVSVQRKGDMYDALVDTFRAQFEVGKQQVIKEIERQTGKQRALEDKAVVGQDELFDLVMDEFSLKVEGAAQKLESMIFDIALKARRAGFSGDSLRREIEKQAGAISDSTWEGIVDGAVNGGWGAGRDKGAEAYADEIDYVYRSAILDSATCDTCRGRDGQTWPTLEDAQIMPDPECEGGDRCRCVNVFVMKAESAGGA